MMQPENHHLAEFNLGILKHDWDDPRVKDFVDGLEVVNGIAKRSAGYVWMLDEEAMEAAQEDPDGALGGHPRMASTLSVWEDLASLEHFVWNTLHKKFYDRRAEWYDPHEGPRMVLWWVPVGHKPTVSEAMQRFRSFERNGPSAEAFDWSYLKSDNVQSKDVA